MPTLASQRPPVRLAATWLVTRDRYMDSGAEDSCREAGASSSCRGAPGGRGAENTEGRLAADTLKVYAAELCVGAWVQGRTSEAGCAQGVGCARHGGLEGHRRGHGRREEGGMSGS